MAALCDSRLLPLSILNLKSKVDGSLDLQGTKYRRDSCCFYVVHWSCTAVSSNERVVGCRTWATNLNDAEKDAAVMFKNDLSSFSSRVNKHGPCPTISHYLAIAIILHLWLVGIDYTVLLFYHSSKYADKYCWKCVFGRCSVGVFPFPNQTDFHRLSFFLSSFTGSGLS